MTIDASTYFRDPNGDALSYAAESNRESVAEIAISGADVTVTAAELGTATVTVTASDPGGLSANQSFGVVVSGTVADEFDSPASLNDWESANAEIAVADGVLNLTNRTEGRLGIAERREMPAVNEWTIQARMGRTTRRASPGVVSLTGHGRFTAVRLVLRTLDDDDRDRDRARDETAAVASRNYEFAVFDGTAGEWVLVTNLSGTSESVLEEPGEFTDLALGHEGGDFVASAGGAGAAEELFRFDLATSDVDGVGLGEIVSDVTGLWLVNQAAPGLTAQHDRVSVTGTGSDATPPDAAAIADAPDAATRNVSVSGPDADRAALVVLYETTDGPNWRNSENWLTDAPLGDWYGVNTDATGRVVTLRLEEWDANGEQRIGNALSGPIPPELGNLANLDILELGWNGLTGPIPPELGGLANLRHLALWANDLTGSIPPELGDLANLVELNLWNSGLTGPIPPELGDLANLTDLNLGSNDLTGPIPPELGDLANLGWLALFDNELTGPIPPELGDLANLTQLRLGWNGLTGPIPRELGGLANLWYLELKVNDLTGPIPPELGDLANLKWLRLGWNGLTGTVPLELGDLANLTRLEIVTNDLTGRLPESLLRLSLEDFWWGNNAGLCAPDTSTFRAWFATIQDHRPGPFCSGATGRGRTTRVEPGGIGPSVVAPGSRPFRGDPPSLFEQRGPPPRPEPGTGGTDADAAARPAPGSELQVPELRGTSAGRNTPRRDSSS